MVAAACLAATAIPGAAAPGETTARENRQLAEVRAATAAYRDVEAAEAAGYESTQECVPGMGIHYVNWSLVFVFDRHLHGPMTHGLPLHYDLYAWVWQGNPDGLFADYNPNAHCDD